MKLGINTDGLPALSLDQVLAFASELGVDCVEFGTGAWSASPHINLDSLLASADARDELTGKLETHDLTVSALTCSGNQLDRGSSGADHDLVARKTIQLASNLGVQRVVLMSGCPPAGDDKHPNWITVAWPPEMQRLLAEQWTEVVLPYWRKLSEFAEDSGVRLCIEMHGQQVVYNIPTFLRLRDAVGAVVGVNFDPSHLMWMGADPIAAIEALGDAIYHVHAKDTRLEPSRLSLRSRLETSPSSEPTARSWNYVTLGYGHGDDFWREFCRTLKASGYDGVLSIEHEDVLAEPRDAVAKSVDLLRRAVLKSAQAIVPPSA